ncbi:MAG: UDP-glucose/GDP-mannose dehydrogenase family protein [Rhodobiaceae bacterium]|nr:UDP-glucose/GDP-mannose dehydrogenase family protein [Rhodobiaceae bacterium]MCC0055206.1 UDP-glucose/GDP-mannose dehydrogenase family protein [Rhodobiaceae bacterium]
MQIVIIGAGYVGLVSGVCLADIGAHVTCVDIDAGRVERLKNGLVPIYEPGLEEKLKSNLAAGRLSFDADPAEPVAVADMVFIAVGTPTREGSGEANLDYVFAAVNDIAPHLRAGTVLVVKSTVPVGTCRRIAAMVSAARPDLDFSIGSNPEFLREGKAIEDFMHPDRLVFGGSDERAANRLTALYRPLIEAGVPHIATSLENAELIKYASNAFLALKVTYINEIANLCERIEGGDAQVIARGIGLDSRIGPKFLAPGPGIGGSCFPKDSRAFVEIGKAVDRRQRLIEEVIMINESRKDEVAGKVLELLGEATGKTVAVLGIAFKPETDDIREAPSLVIIPRLQAAGISVRAHDPEAMAPARRVLDEVVWFDDPVAAAQGADLLVILTEWQHYREMDLRRIADAMKTPLVFDTRLMFSATEIAGSGLLYHSLGRPTFDGRR